MLKRKKRILVINGIKVDGDWITDSLTLMFFDFYKAKFQKFEGVPILRRSQRFNSLDSTQVETLEVRFTMEVIKDVVWSCGGEKSPAPDSFTFVFLKKNWECVKFDVMAFMNVF